MSYTVTTDQPTAAIAVITFADPGRRNQLCWAAVDAIAAALCAAREGGARVLVLASGLAGHWLEHAWLGDLLAGLRGEPQTGTGSGWFEVQAELSHPDIVSIAAISGDCSGGGAELGWACDLRVAERQARFCQPEVRFGLTTGIGGCSRLARLAGSALATDMVMTGAPVSASRLHAVGAVTRLVEAGMAEEAALALAADLAARSPAALAGLKRILADGASQPLPEALGLEQAVFQSVAAGESAQAAMRRAQARYDAGEKVAEVCGYDAAAGPGPD
jgi:enoyl-CoA hydratase/carnithine racemase